MDHTDPIDSPPLPRPSSEIPDFPTYQRLYRQSLEDPETFWRERIARFRWTRPPERILAGESHDARWFPGGRINLAANCLDVPIANGHGDKLALIWESEAVNERREPREIRRYSYLRLRQEVVQTAKRLVNLGVRAGDRVTIDLPIVPELPIAMLACAWLGAIHNVIFAGFPKQALVDRITDSQSKVVITADGGWRNGKLVALKPVVDEAVRETKIVEKVLVLKHAGNAIAWTAGRDFAWDDPSLALGEEPAPEPSPSDAPLFLMYTSGSTGKPKGIVHATAGYLVHTGLSARHAFDLHPGDTVWCTADPAWITGHTYTVYGPLLNATTTIIYEGSLSYPDWDRAWDIIARHRVEVLYSTPTLIRAWLRHADVGARSSDLSSLRLLATVGEPIQPRVWTWFRDVVGAGKTPIVDTWWQTEAGAAMILPLPHITPLKPGAAALPYFGVEAGVVDAQGNEAATGTTGNLVIKRPWPGQLLGIWGNRERYLETYWRKVPGAFTTGDEARRDEDGYFWILGRSDDVIKVNGHRIGTAEIEAAIVAHPSVSEAAVVAVPDEHTGEAILAFVVLAKQDEDKATAERGILRSIEEKVGKIARPRSFTFVPSLPKNRGGKILRRLLREHALTGKVQGDLSTLEDPSALPVSR
jgi:acetyl-CoA synthetase